MNTMNQKVNVETPKSLYAATDSDEFDVTLYNPKTAIEYPAVVVVDHYFNQPPHPGSALTCDTPDDYYGYSEFNYHILDQYGEPSEALSSLVTPDQEAEFEATYAEYLESTHPTY